MAQAKNKYKDALPFSVTRVLPDELLHDVVQTVEQQLVDLPSFGRMTAKRRSALESILANLIKAKQAGESGYCQISMDRNRYSVPKRYDPTRIGYGPTKAVFDGMKSLGLIETKKGFRDKGAYMTRMWMSDNLKERINDKFDLVDIDISDHVGKETVILRDKDKHGNKHDVEYPETAHTRRVRDQLARYQAVIDRFYIDVKLKGYGNPVTIDLDNRQVRRIFNNGSFSQGGRIYGGWWQTVPKNVRKKILIDHKETAEIDFSGMHAVLAYALVGEDYSEIFEDTDPYVLPELPDIERDIVKQAFNIALNCESRTSAYRALYNDLRENGQTLPDGVDAPKLFAAIEQRHPALKRTFYTVVGPRLQNLDSRVTERIIEELAIEEGLGLLVVHDSYIVQASHACRERLAEVMDDALSEIIEKHVGRRPKAIAKKIIAPNIDNRVESPDATTDDEFLEQQLSFPNLEETYKNMDRDQVARSAKWNAGNTRMGILVYEPCNAESDLDTKDEVEVDELVT